MTPPLSWQRSDAVAGLCVAGLLLPEAVAYAGLAHVPVAHALVAVVVGLSIYGLLGGSRFAIVAPTSSSATLVAAAALTVLGGAADYAATDYLQAVWGLGLLCGVLLMALAVTRQGQLSSYISRPVLKGFAFALAVSIVIRQLPDVLGMDLSSGQTSNPLQVLLYVLLHRGQWHLPSLAIAVAAGVLIVALRQWPQVPASLLAMVLAIAASRLLDFEHLGVHAMGAIGPVTIHLGWPSLSLEQWVRAAELAFGLVMLVFSESWGSMRTMVMTRADTLDANRELMILGVCNAGSALMHGMPVGAGFSATSANAAAGSTSKYSGAFALVAIVLVLVFALPALQMLPRPVLAVAVISALWHPLSPKPLMALWKMERDRMLLAGSALAVLFLGVLDGMLVAIGLSIVIAINRFSQPVVSELGELGNSRNYVNLRIQQDATTRPGLLIVRPESPLFFGNAERVVSEIFQRRLRRAGVTSVVLSLEESSDLDSTAVECLLELDARLKALGTTLYIARAKNTVRDLLGRWDALGLGQEQRLFWSVADAAEFASQRQPLL